MAAEAAPNIAPARVPEPTRDRSSRLREVEELVRLYRTLQDALGTAGDLELARLATAGRGGERALAEWTRRVERVRAVKRRLESLTSAGESSSTSPSAALAAVPESQVPWPQAGASETASEDAAEPAATWTRHEPRALPFLWEVAALVAGFTLSWILT